jgi:hypothetical protein
MSQAFVLNSDDVLKTSSKILGIVATRYAHSLQNHLSFSFAFARRSQFVSSANAMPHH